MSDRSYTYTTISAGPDEPTRVRVSFYLDDSARIVVPVSTSGRPHLSISHGDVSVSIVPCPDQVTAQDARIARSLADQAADYAARVEQLAALATDEPGAVPG